MKARNIKIMLMVVVLVVGLVSSVMAVEPKYGGVLTVADDKIQPSLDPQHNMGFGGFELYLAFNTLINYNENLEFVPELAISWEIPNNTTYIFHLREGVTFHDGTEFDAEAVKWNMERMLSEYSQVSSYFKEVNKVEIVDKYTVKFTLKEPYAPFLDSLASNGYMVSPTAVKEMGDEGFQKHPVGTGPFAFVKLDKQNGKLIFEKNKNYWNEGKPYLDKIVLIEIPEDQTRLFALQTGQANFLMGVPASSVKHLKKSSKYNVVSVLSKSNTIDYLTFNCNKEPFNDQDVRLAIAYALDNQKIINFLDQTEAIPGPLPEGSWGHNPALKDVSYDPEKAKELLAQAGYPNGFDVTLKIWSNDPQRSNLAVVVKDMLFKVGIKVNIEVLEASALIQQMTKGEFEFVSLHWGGGGSLDPNGNLHVLFNSKGQLSWIANYNNEEVDEYLEAALKTTDRAKRQELYWNAEKIIVQEHPMIWFGRFVSYLAHDPKVHGIEPLRPSGYFPIYENVWIGN